MFCPLPDSNFQIFACPLHSASLFPALFRCILSYVLNCESDFSTYSLPLPYQFVYLSLRSGLFQPRGAVHVLPFPRLLAYVTMKTLSLLPRDASWLGRHTAFEQREVGPVCWTLRGDGLLVQRDRLSGMSKLLWVVVISQNCRWSPVLCCRLTCRLCGPVWTRFRPAFSVLLSPNEGDCAREKPGINCILHNALRLKVKSSFFSV